MTKAKNTLTDSAWRRILQCAGNSLEATELQRITLQTFSTNTAHKPIQRHEEHCNVPATLRHVF